MDILHVIVANLYAEVWITLMLLVGNFWAKKMSCYLARACTRGTRADFRNARRVM